MARLYLIRHGKAAAGWDADTDPGLDETGRLQAEAMAERLAPLGPLPLVASPLRRTRETALPLERHWQTAARIDKHIAEVPSPVADLAARGAWLAQVMQQRWTAVDSSLQAWRRELLAALAAYETDSVLVSHFVAINVAVGAALGDDRVICFRPDNCSCTVIDVTGGALTLVDKGQEGATRVL
jgi:broad specificity phosphatase PhoE